jgi:hypothetical protein
MRQSATRSGVGSAEPKHSSAGRERTSKDIAGYLDRYSTQIVPRDPTSWDGERATAAAHVGRSLQPWQMGMYEPSVTQRQLSSREIAGIHSICDQWGWQQQSQAVQAAGTRIEQEFQSLALPPQRARPAIRCFEEDHSRRCDNRFSALIRPSIGHVSAGGRACRR